MRGPGRPFGDGCGAGERVQRYFATMPKDAKRKPKISPAAESIRPEELAMPPEGELGDDELENVSGGLKGSTGPVIRTDPKDPACTTKLQ